uniref:Uncharacterized protein n=1 Tax=Thalassia hemprichii TaxID=55496 RepID=A0A4Y1KCM9_9LILI|nr:hypothetical protein [Thalassia hemprichii]ATP74910.1 hypothetical protein [Thalassia hemprichii]
MASHSYSCSTDTTDQSIRIEIKNGNRKIKKEKESLFLGSRARKHIFFFTKKGSVCQDRRRRIIFFCSDIDTESNQWLGIDQRKDPYFILRFHFDNGSLGIPISEMIRIPRKIKFFILELRSNRNTSVHWYTMEIGSNPMKSKDFLSLPPQRGTFLVSSLHLV